MAQITPFQGMRFTGKAGKIEQLVCPPYDIISNEQRLEYLRQNEHNVIRLELPREGEDPYTEAGRVLNGWLRDAILREEDKDSLYVYEEEFEHRGQKLCIRGVICRVKLEEFEKGVVLPHEETLSKAKQDRFQLMQATGCNFSQIYSLYIDDGSTAPKLDSMASGKPDVEFTDGEGLTQRLWICSDEDAITSFCGDFAGRKLYIADGHHRYETAINYRNYLREQGLAAEGDACDYVMMMLVAMDHPGLVVFPTHRVVRSLDHFDSKALLAACEELFELSPAACINCAKHGLDEAYEQGKKAFALYAEGRFTLLTLKDPSVMAKLMPGASAALQHLDVSILHTLVLERIFGIDKENMANQKNLTYTRAPGEAIAAVDEGKANCAFLLNPTRVDEIRDVALAGEKMPQKSTYFYPKLITGLVMNHIRQV